MEGTELKERFTYHAPKPGQPERYKTLRDKALELAELINKEVPEGPERDYAIVFVESAVMWANAGIARRE